MQDHIQISGKSKHAPSGLGFEGDALVPVVQPETETRLEPIVSVFKLLEDYGVLIPSDKRFEIASELEFILDDTGDRAGKNSLLTFLHMMTHGATPFQTGQRMHVLVYLMGNEAKTHTELAAKLKVHPSRISQIIREIPSELRPVCNLKSRTAKGQAIGERE
jgi:hypothetical protein